MADLPADLRALIAARAKATPGPWVSRRPNDGHDPRVFVTREFGVEVPPKFYVAFLPDMDIGDSQPDAILIALAANFIETYGEALAAALERETALREALLHVLTRRHEYSDGCDGCQNAKTLARAALAAEAQP